MEELWNTLSMIGSLLKKVDYIALLALIVAGKTYYSQHFGVEMIVYPYQEKYGDYGVAIENIGKGTAVDYTFKVLNYDKNTDTEIKDFLDTHKLLNGEAKITLAGGKVHYIKIGNQGNVKNQREFQEDSSEVGVEIVEKEYFPTIETRILKWKYNKYYEPVKNSIVCDLKAFDGYPYTEDPNELLRRDMNYQAEKKAREDSYARGLQGYKS